MKPFDIALQKIIEDESRTADNKKRLTTEMVELKKKMEEFPVLLRNMASKDARLAVYLQTAIKVDDLIGDVTLLTTLEIPQRVFSRMSGREVDSNTTYVIVLWKKDDEEDLEIFSWYRDQASRGITTHPPDSHPELLRLIRRLINPETTLDVLFEHRKPVEFPSTSTES